VIERLLKNNNIVKFLAFFLSLILWIYVTGDIFSTDVVDVTRTIAGVPLEWRNLDERIDMVNITTEIDVILRGAPDLVYGIKPQELEVYVDLQGLQEGTHRLTPEAVVPQGIRVESFRPQQVVVELEEVILQHNQVFLEIKGNQAEGLLIGEARLVPDTVFARGSRSLLENIFQIRAIVDITGAEKDVIKTVSVKAVDQQGREVEGALISPETIEVHIPVLEPEKSVNLIISVEGEPAPGFRIIDIKANPASVTVKGKKQLLDEITELTLPVPITDITEDLSVDLEVLVPKGVKVTPDTIRVDIILEEM